MTERQLLEALRDHYAKKTGCSLPCACLRNPQKGDCGSIAKAALEKVPFEHLDKVEPW